TEPHELGRRLDVERGPYSRHERRVGLEGVAIPPAHSKRLDEAQMGRLLERQRGRPSLCPRGGARPVTRELRVADQLLHGRAKLSVQRRALVVDPPADPVAAYVPRSLEKVPAPATNRFLHAAIRQVALEGHDVEIDHAGG